MSALGDHDVGDDQALERLRLVDQIERAALRGSKRRRRSLAVFGASAGRRRAGRGYAGAAADQAWVAPTRAA